PADAVGVRVSEPRPIRRRPLDGTVLASISSRIVCCVREATTGSGIPSTQTSVLLPLPRSSPTIGSSASIRSALTYFPNPRNTITCVVMVEVSLLSASADPSRAARLGSPAMPRVYLSPPHLTGREAELVADAIASNWIAPLGPQVDAFGAALHAGARGEHAL